MKKFICILTLLAIVSLFLVPYAAAGPMEDMQAQIEALQRQLEELKRAQAEMMQTLKAEQQEKIDILKEEQTIEIEAIREESSSLFESLAAKTSVGGYVSLEYEDFDKTRTGENADSTFDHHRTVFNLARQIHPRIYFYSEFEIEGTGSENDEDSEFSIEQAWVDFYIHPAVNLRAGALLIPFGKFNLVHDDPLQDLTDRPLVDRRVIPTTWTEAGAGFFGEFYPTPASIVSYELYAINGLNDEFDKRGPRDAKGEFRQDNNQNKALVGRLATSPYPGVELGLSGYVGKYDDDSDKSIRGGAFDWTLIRGPFELVGEYARFDLEDPESIDDDIPEELQGYYIRLNYHFWPDFLNGTFLAKDFDHPTFTGVFQYDRVNIEDYADADEFGTDRTETRRTIGLNYRPTESWVLKLEYQWNDGDEIERGNADGFLASIAWAY